MINLELKTLELVLLVGVLKNNYAIFRDSLNFAPSH